MRRIWKTIPLVVMGLLLGGALPARAEPIIITSGHVVYSRQNLAGFNARGQDGWRVNVHFGENETNDPPSSRCWDECTAGTSVTLAGSESIINLPTGSIVTGSFLLGGTNYHADRMTFTIDAPNFILPDATGTDPWSPIVGPSFVFRGTLTGTSDRGVEADVPLFGTGRTLLSIDDARWFATNYQFQDQSPVPEPGTWLLFATGIAAVLRRRLISK